MLYKVSMNKNDFFKLHNKISTRNLVVSEDSAEFEVELGAYNIIKDSGYKYELKESLKTKITIFFKSYYLLIFGILFLFSILYINSYRVSKIVFNIDTPINEDIEEEIKSTYKKLFAYNFSNADFTALSKKLQRKYIEYPYIAVYSSNNDIKVDIYKEDEYPTISSVQFGNIVAKKDAVIDSFYIYNGIGQIHKNQYVKKGDILIAATENKGGQGMILGYSYERITLDINKNEKIIEETGNTQKYKIISIFGKEIKFDKKESFDLYNEEVDVKFNLFDIFKVKEIEEKEKNAIIKEYTENEAIEIAKAKINSVFTGNRVAESEQIVDIYQYSIKEKDDKYQCTFIVKKLESIGELVTI